MENCNRQRLKQPSHQPTKKNQTGTTPKTTQKLDQDPQMSSQTFQQQIEKNKNTQKTTWGLVTDDSMGNMKDKKQLFQELRKQNNIQTKPKYVKPTYLKDEEMDKIRATIGILNVNWDDVRAWKHGNRSNLINDTP